MKKKSILYLDYWGEFGEYFRNRRNECEYVDSFYIYNKNNMFSKFCKYINYKLNIPIEHCVYGKWKKNIQYYDIVIIDSRKWCKNIIKYIKSKNKKARIVIFYWNEITNREINPQYCKDIGCEVWSFDKDDCKKYGLKYCNTYYFLNNISLNSNNKLDLFYIGADREGRIDLLKKLESVCNDNKLKYSFNLTKSKIKKTDKSYKYSSQMPYDKVLENIYNSKAIVELTKKTQYGVTLRAMESLFFKKKLITDNKNISKYTFYNINNIFIMDNNIEMINEFLNKPYKEIDDSEIKKYEFGNWICRIIKGEEFE